MDHTSQARAFSKTNLGSRLAAMQKESFLFLSESETGQPIDARGGFSATWQPKSYSYEWLINYLLSIST